MGLLTMVAPAHAAWQGRLRLEVGGELDTNASRDYDQVATDGLTRLVVDASLNYEDSGHQLQLEYFGGAKIFYQNPKEDLLTNRLALQYLAALESTGFLGLRLRLHDASMVEHRRDFFSVDAEAFRSARINSWLAWEISLGMHGFLFKPETLIRTYDHLGPFAGARFFFFPIQDLSLEMGYQLMGRFFPDMALVNESGSLIRGERKRLEQRHVLHATLRMQFATADDLHLILQAGYLFTYNESNSYGSEARWHRIQALISADLPAGFGIHLMGTFQLSKYLDGLYIDGDLYEPDADENENSVVFRISYEIDTQWSLFFQGSIYRNELGQGLSRWGDFGRETYLLALSWQLSL